MQPLTVPSPTVRCWVTALEHSEMIDFAFGVSPDEAFTYYPFRETEEQIVPPFEVTSPPLPDTVWPLYQFHELPEEMQNEIRAGITKQWERVCKAERMPIPDNWPEDAVTAFACRDDLGEVNLYNRYGHLCESFHSIRCDNQREFLEILK